MDSKTENGHTNIPIEHSSYPPPYFVTQYPGQQPVIPIGQQPQSFYPGNNGAPIIVSQQFGSVDILECLANHNTLFLKQLSPYGPRSIEMMYICDENQVQVFNVCIETTSYSNGRVGAHHGNHVGVGAHHRARHYSTLTKYTLNDASGRIVLEFEEANGGIHVKSGGFSLGVIQGTSLCSTEIIATASTGFQSFNVQGQGNPLCPFGIKTFPVTSNGIAMGSFEKVSDANMKIHFCDGLDVKTKALLVALSLKTYVDFASNGYGCSSGRRGCGMMCIFASIAMLFVPVIIFLIIFFVLKNKAEKDFWNNSPGWN